MKKYIDSNIFLNALLYNDAKANKCREIILKIISKEIQVATSVVTWDELVYVLQKNLTREIAIKEGKKFLSFPNLLLVEVSNEIINKAQSLIENYKINPRDAIHCATALQNNIHEIISDDNDFKVIKEIKLLRIDDF